MELGNSLRSHPRVLFCIWISFEKKSRQIDSVKKCKSFIIHWNKWNLETRFARILVFCFASGSALKKSRQIDLAKKCTTIYNTWKNRTLASLASSCFAFHLDQLGKKSANWFTKKCKTIHNSSKKTEIGNSLGSNLRGFSFPSGSALKKSPQFDPKM